VNLQKKIGMRRKRRLFRTRNKFKNSNRGVKRLRVTVFKSSRYIYSQIIDDEQQITLVGASSLECKNSGKNKKDHARMVGEMLGERSLKKDIKNVFFDRGIYRYHGRVASFADGLRSKGINF
jgi:large subunit ribosomal protein L18